MEVVQGQLLAGKYRVEQVLGRGGMGVVVAAHHVVLDETVALKFLLPEAIGGAEAIARFEREARNAVKIKSEHVARVTDVGRLENGAPYMVMELLRGRDLEVLLQERGPLPLTDVADYILQAGEAIAEAHGLGIVHRDLKPPNLFLTERADGSSCIKVLDFGISKLTSADSQQNMTRTTAVMGSPLYMSPEQLMSSRDVDMRTDIWALGVICFELLTGQTPFQGESLPQLCMAISLAPPASLRNYRPDLPPEVESILLRCLSKDPSQRYASVAELATELVKFAPPHSRISAERIERLAQAAGFTTTGPLSRVSAGVVAQASTSTSTRTRDGSETIGGFGQTRPGSASKKLRVGLLIGAAVLSLGVFAFVRSTRAKLDPVVVTTGTPALPAPVEPAPSSAPETTPTIAPAPEAPAVPPTASARAPLPVHTPVAQKPLAVARPTAPPPKEKPTAAPAASSQQKSTLGGRL